MPCLISRATNAVARATLPASSTPTVRSSSWRRNIAAATAKAAAGTAYAASNPFTTGQWPNP